MVGIRCWLPIKKARSAYFQGPQLAGFLSGRGKGSILPGAVGQLLRALERVGPLMRPESIFFKVTHKCQSLGHDFWTAGANGSNEKGGFGESRER